MRTIVSIFLFVHRRARCARQFSIPILSSSCAECTLRWLTNQRMNL